MQRSSASRQSGAVSPKVAKSLWFDSREFFGRTAAVGLPEYAAVGIALIIGLFASVDVSKMA